MRTWSCLAGVPFFPGSDAPGVGAGERPPRQDLLRMRIFCLLFPSPKLMRGRCLLPRRLVHLVPRSTSTDQPQDFSVISSWQPHFRFNLGITMGTAREVCTAQVMGVRV